MKRFTLIFLGLVLIAMFGCEADPDSGDDTTDGDQIVVDGDKDTPSVNGDVEIDDDILPDGDDEETDSDAMDGDNDDDNSADGDTEMDSDGDYPSDGDTDLTDGDIEPDWDIDPDLELESDAEQCPEMWEGPAPPDCQQWDCSLESWPTCWVCDLVADPYQDGQSCSYCEGECECTEQPCVCLDGACINDPNGDGDMDDDSDWETELDMIDSDLVDGDTDDESFDSDIDDELESETDLDGSTIPSFVSIPAGTFWMGSPDGCPGPLGYPGDCTSELGGTDAEDLHFVDLTYNFEMMTTEVTQDQWRTVAQAEGWGEEPSYFSECGDACPVELVNWYEALEYANVLSRNAGLTECYILTNCTGGVGDGCEGGVTCRSPDVYECVVALNDVSKPQECEGYRLPTEAEWEYAIRAQQQYTAFHLSDGNDGTITQPGWSPLDPNLDQIGWYGGNSEASYAGAWNCSEWPLSGPTACGPQPVGSKESNMWGLHDMSGNLWEWNWDRYQDSYQNDVVADPVGPATGSDRLFRGGSWMFPAAICRSASRGAYTPDLRVNYIGFRLIRTLPDPSCEEDACNSHGDCDDTGDRVSCTCHNGYGGYWCSQCALGYEGQLCDRCSQGYEGYPDCQPIPAPVISNLEIDCSTGPDGRCLQETEYPVTFSLTQATSCTVTNELFQGSGTAGSSSDVVIDGTTGSFNYTTGNGESNMVLITVTCENKGVESEPACLVFELFPGYPNPFNNCGCLLVGCQTTPETPFCNPETGQCAECVTNEHCPEEDNLFCTTNEGCNPDTLTCQIDPYDCHYGTCDEEADTCRCYSSGYDPEQDCGECLEGWSGYPECSPNPEISNLSIDCSTPGICLANWGFNTYPVTFDSTAAYSCTAELSLVSGSTASLGSVSDCTVDGGYGFFEYDSRGTSSSSPTVIRITVTVSNGTTQSDSYIDVELWNF